MKLKENVKVLNKGPALSETFYLSSTISLKIMSYSFEAGTVVYVAVPYGEVSEALRIVLEADHIALEEGRIVFERVDTVFEADRNVFVADRIVFEAVVGESPGPFEADVDGIPEPFVADTSVSSGAADT